MNRPAYSYSLSESLRGGHRGGFATIQTALRTKPRVQDVALEQIRIVGLALRLPAIAAAVLFGLATLILAVLILRLPRHGPARRR